MLYDVPERVSMGARGAQVGEKGQQDDRVSERERVEERERERRVMEDRMCC